MTERKKPDAPRQPKPEAPRKPTSPHYKGDNSGGYGNPPKDGQFKPKNAGGGRPKGSKSMSAALRKMFASKVQVRRGDKLVHSPTVEALATRIRDRALTGSDKALFLAQQLANEFGPREEVNVDSSDDLDIDWDMDFSNFSKDELNILNLLLTRAMCGKDVVDKSKLRQISGMEGRYRLFERDDGFVGIERDEKFDDFELNDDDDYT